MAAARLDDPKVLVEAAVDGPREIEVGVLQGLDGGPPEASVAARSRSRRRARVLRLRDQVPADDDFTALIDARPTLPDEVAAQMRALSVTRVRGDRRAKAWPGSTSS